MVWVMVWMMVWMMECWSGFKWWPEWWSGSCGGSCSGQPVVRCEFECQFECKLYCELERELHCEVLRSRVASRVRLCVQSVPGDPSLILPHPRPQPRAPHPFNLPPFLTLTPSFAVAEAGLITVVPDDNAALVALQAITGLAAGAYLPQSQPFTTRPSPQLSPPTPN